MKIRPMPCVTIDGRMRARVTRRSRFGAWPRLAVWYPYGFANSVVWEWHG